VRAAKVVIKLPNVVSTMILFLMLFRHSMGTWRTPISDEFIEGEVKRIAGTQWPRIRSKLRAWLLKK
jgi:hypothetical protein